MLCLIMKSYVKQVLFGTTAENQQIESEHYVVMDTPGINANDDDTAVAERRI